MYDPFANFTIHSLSNGVPVHVLYMPERSFAIVEIIFHAGMRDDVNFPCGTAHFLEHMVCANSGYSLNGLHVYFGSVGGGFNAVTNFESTRYGFKVPIGAAEFSGGLEIWATACLQNPHDNHFDREMTIIESEIKRKYPTLALMDCNNRIEKLHFRGLSYGQAPSATGTLESLAKITPQTLAEYRDRFYTTNNISIVCVGGMLPEQLLEKLEHTILAQVMTGSRNVLANKLTNFSPLNENDLELHLGQEKKLGQANVLVKTLFPGSFSAEALEVASGMISKLLYEEVRERAGLAYQMGVSTYNYGPLQEMSIEISSFPEQNIEKVRLIVERILNSFAANMTLFEKEKHVKLARYLTKDYTVEAISRGALGEISRHGRISSDAEEMERVSAVSEQDLEYVAENFKRKEQVLHATICV